eukprot:968226_1
MSFVKLITSISVVLLIHTPSTSCGFLYAVEKDGTLSKVDTITKQVTLDICVLPAFEKYTALAYDCINMKMYATVRRDPGIHELDIPTCTLSHSTDTMSGSAKDSLGIRELNPVTG